MVLDADVIPSSEAFASLEWFLKTYDFDSQLDNTALILPVLELEESLCSLAGSLLPQDRRDLLAAVKAGVARPFYSEVNAAVQRGTDFPRWYRLDSEPGRAVEKPGWLNLAYWQDWSAPFEPFLVMPTQGSPAFDPKFTGYGQLCLSLPSQSFLSFASERNPHSILLQNVSDGDFS